MSRTRKNLSTTGFTIVEVVFIVVVIAILAIGILMLYTNMREKARDSQRMVDLQTINSAMHQMYGDQNRYKSPDVVAAYLLEKKFINIIPTDPYPYRSSAKNPSLLANLVPSAHASSKETVCHNGKTLRVSSSAVSAHLGHGDTMGTCAGGEGGETETVCVAADNMAFYNALSPSASGVYPFAGMSSDQVTLTSGNPLSMGSLEIHFDFSDIPETFSNAELSMDFVDLDLQGDELKSGSKRVSLFEQFELRDANGSTLAGLDENSGEDDDFTWTISIDDSLITGESLSLDGVITTSVELTKGNSLSISNAEEGIENIFLCGEVAEEEIEEEMEVSTICHLDTELQLEETIEVPSEEVGLHFSHGDYVGACDGRTDWSAADKEDVCHVLGDEPSTMNISSSAVAAHLAHGDYLGECDEEGDSSEEEDEEETGGDSGGSGETTFFDICHITGGGELNLTVAQNSLQAHLAHGDYEGDCDGRATSGGGFGEDEWEPDCETEICGEFHYVYGVADDPETGEYGQVFEVSAAFESTKNSIRLGADGGNDTNRFEIGMSNNMVNTHYLDPDALPAGQNLFEGEIISAKVLSIGE